MKSMKLGESERELLVYVAQHPDSTVREVADHFSAARGWARTTSLKTMDRLVDKGYLIRHDEAGVFRYRATISESELQERQIRQLYQGSLGGSIRPLVAFLDGQATVSADELKELRALVERLEERNR